MSQYAYVKKQESASERLAASGAAVAARVFKKDAPDYATWLNSPFNPRVGRTRPVPDYYNLEMPHIKAIIRLVQGMADGTERFTILCSPPRHFKTSLAVQYAVLWLTETFPGCNILIICADANRAIQLSRMTREIARDLNLLSTDEAAEEWRTKNGSSLIWKGAGQAIRGLNCDFVCCDDPIPSTAAANSEIDREARATWFDTDVMQRKQDWTSFLIVYTPSHYDDFPQRLLRKSEWPWKAIRMPIKAEKNDYLGREPGEWLAPMPNDEVSRPGKFRTGVFRLAEYEMMERDLLKNNPSEWQSTYMVRPGAAEGDLIHADRIKIVDSLPPQLTNKARCWDLAASTRSTSDETVGALGGQFIPDSDPNSPFYHPSGQPCMFVEDVSAGRYDPGTRDATIRTTAEMDGIGVKIRLPKDPGESGVRTVASLTPSLHGFSFMFKPPVGTKQNRAGELATLVNQGRVFFLKADWNEATKDQLRRFPNDAFDDRVDSISDLSHEVMFIGDHRFPFEQSTHTYDTEFFEDTFGGVSDEKALLKDDRLFSRWGSFVYSTDSTFVGCWLLLWAKDIHGTVYLYDEVPMQGSFLQEQAAEMHRVADFWDWHERRDGKDIIIPVFCEEDFKKAREMSGQARWVELAKAGIPMIGKKTDPIEGFTNIEVTLNRTIKGDPAFMVHRRCRFTIAYLNATPRDPRYREDVDPKWVGRPCMDALRIGLTNQQRVLAVAA